MNLRTEPKHTWGDTLVLKSFFIGAIVEAVAIAPAVLSPWGHAGPESFWGWLGLLVNAPGLFVVWLLRTISGTTESIGVIWGIACVYLIQTLLFSYVAFLGLRRKS